jgi:3-phenylpropionate/trans-cinnamate dioxygenase ferredoxin component
MGGFVRAATLADVPEGGVLGVEVEGARVCLAKVEGEVFAFQDRCSHRDFPLSNGEVDPDDCTITCEWHGAAFDMRSGAARSLPATRPIAVYPVTIEGDDILVDVSGG